ncbi:MAG: TIGR03936 family radical SAM-associated protein [Butyrivibrio sp.]|nr:TIGR03936 family radical SAM-associated protein [Butyrivibrio sp.]
MKLRVKFTKNGPIRFIGHLDLQRYFQKAIRRADIDVKYSEGYSPHQVISFAQPLSVGATSDGEYMDMQVNSMESCEDIKKRLNEVMNEGVEILDVIELSEKAPKAMTAVAAAEYRVAFRKGKEPSLNLKEKLAEYYNLDKLPAVKKTKSGEKEIDMKPYIYELSVNEDDSIHMLLSAGSVNNIKVSMVIENFLEFYGEELKEFGLIIHRVDTYIEGNDDKGRYIEPFICRDLSKRKYI